MLGDILKSGELRDYRAMGIGGSPVYGSADQLRYALQRESGKDFVAMLASVKQSQRGGSFDFYAPKVGEAVSWTQAAEEQRQEARPYLRQLRDDVTALSQRYASASGPDAQEQKVFSALLLQALKIPDEDHGFILDGKPVLTFWGFMKPDAAEDEDVIARMLDEQTVTAAAPVLPPPPLEGENDSRRWWVSWWWLLLLLLLLLWLGWKNWDSMPWQPKELAACPEVAPEGKKAVKNVVVVLDVSGSMLTPTGLNDKEADALMTRVYDEELFSSLQLRLNYLLYGRSRLSSAQKALTSVVAGLPDTVRTGMVLAGNCDGVDTRDYFDLDKRGELIDIIKSAQVDGGTPLGKAIRAAGDMVPGTGEDSLIVVLSDGMDSCYGNPCAEASRLARIKPGVRINVVDIGNAGAGGCLAEATGGKVIVADQTEDLSQMLAQAANDLSVPEHCR